MARITAAIMENDINDAITRCLLPVASCFPTCGAPNIFELEKKYCYKTLKLYYKLLTLEQNVLKLL